MGGMLSVKGGRGVNKDSSQALVFRVVTDIKAMVTPSYVILVTWVLKFKQWPMKGLAVCHT